MGKNKETFMDEKKKMYVALFVSRNKDNKNLPNFKERREAFVTNKSKDDQALFKRFRAFVDNGSENEVCRYYYSVNARDEEKIKKELLHYLIDHPEINLVAFEQKLASIAAKQENAAEKKWLFDFDVDNYDKKDEFINDIHNIDPEVEVLEEVKTPHGFGIIVNRGFDIRTLKEKWGSDFELKRDDLVFVSMLITQKN